MKKKRLNNKGFTLIELLAVLVILIAIMSIAIPSISSSMERSKAKQDESRKKILESAAELYITDNKNNLGSANECKILLGSLKNYVDEDALKDSSDIEFSGVIVYNKSAGTYKYENFSSVNKCVS